MFQVWQCGREETVGRGVFSVKMSEVMGNDADCPLIEQVVLKSHE